ncbi:T9SS type A sorting domain-containing protein [Algoriphagus sp. NBT04N3]|uniref:glycine-rich domain-containing protein n=1 Tax=Algoriphagus sp. NBT04N3 TaxID=2705473 RepID=UPI001C6392DD|nr:T9SS type A sorting domain-containing protein [Algoriphagus sp. NBT04N3]QYH37815.1 T9SS type A sorting domain-containing protein [Algoriphagus sp. NBT04N3]
MLFKQDKFIYALTILLLIIFISDSIYAQCNSCDVIIDGNNAPSGTIQNGSLVCIRGDRTSNISFNNRNNISICIEDGASWNGAYSQLSGLASLSNYGNLSISNSPNGNWSIFNYGVLNWNSTISSNKSIYNYGELNFGSGLVVSSAATLISNGTVNFSGLTTFNSNSIIKLIGMSNFSGSVILNSNTIVELAGNLAISGTLQLNSNSQIRSLNNNVCNSLNVGGTITNLGTISGSGLQIPNSPLYVNKAPVGNGLSDGATVGSCPTASCVEMIEITTSTGFDRVYIFNCTDNLILPELLPDEQIIDVSATLVGGAGGGGFGEAAGGGGSGGITSSNAISLLVGRRYPVAVGPGGFGSTQNNSPGRDGLESSFFGLISNGGGGGGSQSSSARDGRNGGSGGGGGANNNPGNGSGNGGAVIAGNLGNQGGNGRRQNNNQLNGGGGGGAATPGEEGRNNNPGSGGNGISLPILNGVSGVLNAFAGGGGSTGRNPAQQYGKGTGGVFQTTKLGGDGDHLNPGDSNSDGIGGAGLPFTGSGGGAGSVRGGAGSAGKVIIRVSYRILSIDLSGIQVSWNKEQNSAELRWSISGLNEDITMVVQRGLNQIKSWENLDSLVVQSGKEGLMNFKFYDDKLYNEEGYAFYRIKLYNKDKFEGYSNTVSLKLEPPKLDANWRVFPNPVGNSDLQITYRGDENKLKDGVIVLMSDYSGRIKSSQFFNIEDIKNWVNENLIQSGQGIYFLKIQSAQFTETFKIFK